MGPQDGVDHALRALAALRALRDDWHAVFIGDGDALPAMRALADELGAGRPRRVRRLARRRRHPR